jgi:hypothetical protein
VPGTPEVPFCAALVMAAAAVLARCSAPDRVRSAATAALAGERGPVCPDVGVGGLRARDRCCTRNGTSVAVCPLLLNSGSCPKLTRQHWISPGSWLGHIAERSPVNQCSEHWLTLGPASHVGRS